MSFVAISSSFMSLFQDHVLNRAVLIVIPFSILQDKMLFSYTHRGVFYVHLPLRSVKYRNSFVRPALARGLLRINSCSFKRVVKWSFNSLIVCCDL